MSQENPYPQGHFLLIDGMAMVFRGFYAIPKLTSSTGQPTNAVYGFFMILINLLLQLQPERVAICFDRKETTERKELFADYKANRSKAPDELLSQIPIIKEGITALNSNLVEKAGFEADDLLATLAIQEGTKENPAIIYTSDLDILQLANQDSIFILTPHNQKNNILINQQAVITKYGFTPQQIPDYKGLHGDPSDNLPGVKGIGKKTAAKLLAEYQTLEGIYEHLDELTPSMRAKFTEHKKIAHLCKQLATLMTDVETPTPDSKYKSSQLNITDFKKFLENYELKTLLKKLEKVSRVFNIKEKQDEEDQMALF